MLIFVSFMVNCWRFSMRLVFLLSCFIFIVGGFIFIMSIFLGCCRFNRCWFLLFAFIVFGGSWFFMCSRFFLGSWLFMITLLFILCFRLSILLFFRPFNCLMFNFFLLLWLFLFCLFNNRITFCLCLCVTFGVCLIT